jgi:hypothetical protein
MPQEFVDFFPPHGSPQQRPGDTDHTDQLTVGGLYLEDCS